MHKLSSHAVGMSLSLTVGILYILCAVAYVILPSLTKASLIYMMHGLNIESLITSITFWPTVIGLVVTLVYTYIAGAIFAYIWNAVVPPSERK